MKTAPKQHPATMEHNRKVGDRFLRFASVSCRKCDEVGEVMVSKGHTLLAPAAVEKKFAQMGWHIGRNVADVVCPRCRGIKVKQLCDEDEMATVTPIVKPEPPRVMGREDRRIVFEKLNGVYIDEKRGYDSGWSDQKVANDLGVPRAWIEQVREEMFGPVASNPEMEAFVKAVADLDQFKKQLMTAAALQTQLNNIQTVLKGIDSSGVLERISRLEKLASDVKKHCVAGK